MVFVSLEIIVLFHLLVGVYHKFPLTGFKNGPAVLHCRSRHPSFSRRVRLGNYVGIPVRESIFAHNTTFGTFLGPITYRI